MPFLENKEDIAIVVPVYRSILEKTETLSFCQTLHVLGNYPIFLVCPEQLDISGYIKISMQNGITLRSERFSIEYFNGIEGYNRLLLSMNFYSRFKRFEYILICQLDAFIFKDDLHKWCKKKYDYIGAPIIGSYTDEYFQPKEMKVGNGGLSLRRVQAYLDFFSGKKNVIPLFEIAKRILLKNKVHTRWLVWLMMACGWHNKPKSYAKEWRYNEDMFWSGTLDGTNYALSKPTPREAMEFAFERFPKELYEITGKIPFGCHAWLKYQYDSFWVKYIAYDERHSK